MLFWTNLDPDPNLIKKYGSGLFRNTDTDPTKMPGYGYDQNSRLRPKHPDPDPTQTPESGSTAVHSTQS